MITQPDIEQVSEAIFALARTIYPLGACPGTDAYGGHVASLTESVMGITGGLMAIAESIQNVANELEIQRTEK
jgi:hypothetical protein